MTARIFQAIPLAENKSIQLDEQAHHHLSRVLRAKVNDPVIVFNGKGGEYLAKIITIDKKTTELFLEKFIRRDNESPLELYLAQGISRGEKMDFTIQKAVELGVKKIIPLFTERCNVKLNHERQEKKLLHWQSIIISACEQCGRNKIPEILSPQKLEEFLQVNPKEVRLVLSPHTQQKLSALTPPAQTKIILFIGPEGGFSEYEVKKMLEVGFFPLNLGPRVLRTETAAIAAITALQAKWGDLIK